MKKLFMIIPLVFLLCFTFSCQNQTEVEEQNKALVKRMYVAFNTGDFEAYKEVIAPEYIWYFPYSNH